MHSSVLTGAVSVPGHMSASGSRGIIHRQSSVVAVARATGKISCFPPPLVCIRTVSARAELLHRQSLFGALHTLMPRRSGRGGDALRQRVDDTIGSIGRGLEAKLGAVPPHRVHNDG